MPTLNLPLSLASAVAVALAQHPAIQTASASVAAAVAGVQLARTAFLPSLEFAAQGNRATDNNTTGLLFPQAPLLPISGAVNGTVGDETAWGSAFGLLLDWEFLDFGERAARIDAARTEQAREQAGATLAAFTVASETARDFLSLVAAEQAVAAQQAGVVRTEVLVRVVGRLVASGLRPGVDTSRADAELARAQLGLIHARAIVGTRQATLAGAMGTPIASLSVAATPFLSLPPAEDLAPASIDAHPLVREYRAAIQVARSREGVLQRADYPRLDLLADLDTRGSDLGPVPGLPPGHWNMAAAVTLDYPLLAWPSIRAKLASAQYQTQAADARYLEALDRLEAQQRAARVLLAEARQVAATTPRQLAAARAEDLQERARYRAGLATLLDLADAERTLTRAEVENRLAQVQVWRAMLGVAVAQGDLSWFMRLAGG